MSSYILRCSVCKTSFETRRGWLSHLLEPSHQNQARKEIISWDFEKRACVLVAFAGFPVANEKVLQYFNWNVDRDAIVTDFVWSEKRPRVGIIQFESR